MLLVLFTYDALAVMRMPTANRECASCHVMWLTDFKREDVTTLIPYDPKPVMNTGKQDIASSEPICLSCHDGFVLESRFLWQEGKHAHPVGVKPSNKITLPVVDGKNLFPLNDDGKMYCGTCHSAHGVDWSKKDTTVFMRIENEDGQLCMACHTEKINGPNHGNHPVKVKIQGLLNSPPEHLMASGSRFARDGGVVCQSCHRPHAAPENPILLMKNSNSQLCGECHKDLYTNDLKQSGKHKTHPVNIVSDTIRVSNEMKDKGSRLGENGEIICQTCHRPHNAENNTRILVKNNLQDQLCQTCHLKQKSVLNGKHDMALVSPESKNIKDVSAKSGACSVCHLPHKGTGPKMWARAAVQDTEAMAALCLSCHNKDSLAAKHTIGDYSHPVGIEINRLGHTVDLPTYDDDGFKSIGNDLGKVTCASCHDPHQWDSTHPDDKGKTGEKGNNRNRFLRIANGSDAALCKRCHDDKWEVTESKHDMRLMAPDSKNALGQKVDESGICGSCHLVHNALGPKLWARTDLQGQGTGYIACIGCHNKNGIAKNKTMDMDHTHPMDIPVNNLGIEVTAAGWTTQNSEIKNSPDQINRLVKLPLYDHHGRPAIENGRVGCGTCHDPHKWSSLPYTKNKHPEDIEGDANSSFLRIADQGKSQLCLNCHRNKQSVLFTKHDLVNNPGNNKNKSGEKVKDSISSVGDRGTCLQCHQPHNTQGPALWGRNLGKAEAPIAQLCLDCHKQGGLADTKQVSGHNHPLAKSIGNLNNDQHLPLFDDTGNRTQQGGNIDCASCHNPHQWSPESVDVTDLSLLNKEGDASNSFLRITANYLSALCINCHADKKTIIGTDHDLSVTVPKASNILQQPRDVSGLCGQCHVPHHATEENYIWSREVGVGDNPVDQKCRSCHQADNIAGNKNPAIAYHPGLVSMWSPELRQLIKESPANTMPVFDENGKRTVFGKITCASCHNPHRWKASHNHSGTGKNLEGDAESSFLRVDDTRNFICSDCHDKDGLFRYKYFHGESTHQQHRMFK